MRKIGLFAVMLAMALALGMFAGCEGTVQEIEGSVSINDQAPPQVEKVTITPTTDKRYYIVRWDAVEGDVSYSVYYKQDKKNSMLPLYNVGTQNLYNYADADGSESPNDNLDKWSSWISLDNLRANIKKGGDYRIGVRTSFNSGVGYSEAISSEVQWSEPITIYDLKSVSKPDVKQTTDGNYIIVSWTAVDGAASYEVYENYGDNFSYEGLGQNDYIYNVDGTRSNNSDKLKWSYKYMSSGYSGTYKFKVRAITNDISFVPAQTDSEVGSVTITK
jgi:hypothetical protein